MEEIRIEKTSDLVNLCNLLHIIFIDKYQCNEYAIINTSNHRAIVYNGVNWYMRIGHLYYGIHNNSLYPISEECVIGEQSIAELKKMSERDKSTEPTKSEDNR
jgi:hypothetical protein